MKNVIKSIVDNLKKFLSFLKDPISQPEVNEKTFAKTKTNPRKKKLVSGSVQKPKRTVKKEFAKGKRAKG